MSDARQQFFQQQLEWCRDQIEQSEKALDLYERGVMHFRVNNVDVTQEQIASLRRIIQNMNEMIERILADA